MFSNRLIIIILVSIFVLIALLTSNSASLAFAQSKEASPPIPKEKQDASSSQEQRPIENGTTTAENDTIIKASQLFNEGIPPTADAGPNQEVNEGDNVTLDGTGSLDTDGTIVSYSWSLEESDDEDPDPVLNGFNIATPTFTASNLVSPSSVYGFELKVTDNDGLIDDDFVVIRVKKTQAQEPAPNNPLNITTVK